MFRAATVFFTLLATHSLTGSNLFAQSCSCQAPSCVAPSCAVPSDYFSPTCAAPGVCGGASASCQSGPTCGGCEKCCKLGKGRWINIDLSRTVNKGDKIKKNSGGFWGEAPPVGTSVVMTSPVLFSNAAAIPVSFQTASTDNTAAIAAAVAAVMSQQQKANASAAAAAANPDSKCNDPCGDIKQLQSDVQQLKQITVNLTNVVEKLVDKQP